MIIIIMIDDYYFYFLKFLMYHFIWYMYMLYMCVHWYQTTNAKLEDTKMSKLSCAVT